MHAWSQTFPVQRAAQVTNVKSQALSGTTIEMKNGYPPLTLPLYLYRDVISAIARTPYPLVGLMLPMQTKKTLIGV